MPGSRGASIWIAAALVVGASPALAKPAGGADGAAAALTQAGQALSIAGSELASPRHGPSGGIAAARVMGLASARNRAAVPAGPAADYWANLPDFALSYRAGKRGPVIELGAFGFEMRPMPGGSVQEDDSFAHLSLAWNF